LVTASSDFTPASIVASPLPPPQPPLASPLLHPTMETDTGFRVHPTVETDTGFHVHPTVETDMPDASSPVPDTPHNRDSPRRFSLPAEEDVLCLEEGALCNIEYGQWLALHLVKSEMGTGWHWGWCGSWCHNEIRIFDSTWSEIM
jgi:hypothetical protein